MFFIHSTSRNPPPDNLVSFCVVPSSLLLLSHFQPPQTLFVTTFFPLPHPRVWVRGRGWRKSACTFAPQDTLCHSRPLSSVLRSLHTHTHSPSMPFPLHYLPLIHRPEFWFNFSALPCSRRGTDSRCFFCLILVLREMGQGCVTSSEACLPTQTICLPVHTL